MRARCRVCWSPRTLTRRGLVWWHLAPVRWHGRRVRCLGAGLPPLGQPGPEFDLLPEVLDARMRFLAPEHLGGTVYLLHLDPPFQHARHYLGWAGPGNLSARLAHHAAGSGANLLLHAAKAGSTWRLARTWSGDRYLERRLKRRGGAARVCPVCRPELAERVLPPIG